MRRHLPVVDVTDPCVLAVFLRPSEDSTPAVEGVFALATMPVSMEMRMRYNPDIRGGLIKFPPGTRAEQVIEAVTLLQPFERQALYARMRG